VPVIGGLDSCVSLGREIKIGDNVEILCTVMVLAEAIVKDLWT
jgi:hypothetical protein